MPCLVYPDPKYIKEDEAAKLLQEAEANAKKQEMQKQKQLNEEKRIKASQVEDDLSPDKVFDQDMENSEEEQSKKSVQEAPLII